MLHFALMLCARRYDIDAGRIDACVSENVCEPRNVLFNRVKGSCEQVPEVVRKDLTRRHVRIFAQRLHFPPDIVSADRSSAPCDEYRSRIAFLLLDVAKQFLLQLGNDENAAVLALAAHDSLSLMQCLDRDILQLAHADAAAADRLRSADL